MAATARDAAQPAATLDPMHPEDLPEKHALIAKATGVTASGMCVDGADG